MKLIFTLIYKGSVIFKPSDRFQVEFNVSASDINELHAINYSLNDDFDIVTLNVVSEKKQKKHLTSIKNLRETNSKSQVQEILISIENIC